MLEASPTPGDSQERGATLPPQAGRLSLSRAVPGRCEPLPHRYVWDRTVPAERHGVYARHLRRVRLKGIENLGLERAVGLLRQHGRPVRGGMIESADRTWTFPLFLTEDGSALVACAGVQRVVEESPL